MSQSTNTLSGPSSSITKLAIVSLNSYFVEKTDLDNTINDIFEKIIDKFDNQD